MSLRDEILSQVQQVGREQDKRLAPLRDDLLLVDSGLDSLCFAVLVARLETTLGLDPFSENEDVLFPETLGEFIRLYENAGR